MTQKNSVSAWGKPLLQNCQIELSHAVKNYGSDIQIIGKGVQEGYYVYIIFSNKDVINIYIYKIFKILYIDDAYFKKYWLFKNSIHFQQFTKTDKKS